jgi:O-antigen/teichoic acid export membrane protein
MTMASRSPAARRSFAGDVATWPAIVRTSGAYFLAQGVLILSGFISMPIMTRLLSREEYGLLSLTFTTVAVVVIVTSLGLGDATVRLYGEWRLQGAASLRSLCESVLTGAAVMGTLAAVAVVLLSDWIGSRTTSDYGSCLRLASALVVIRAVSVVLYQIYRAQERAFAHSASQVAARCGVVALAVPLLLVGERVAATVILATIIIESLVVLLRLGDLWRRGIVERLRLARPVLTAAAVYGMPLALAGAARFFLDYGDRFVIERLLGLNAVAVYTVPYDLAQKLADCLIAPLQLAVVPILFRLWAERGRETTAELASSILSYILVGIIPIAALYLLFQADLLVLIASAKYRDSTVLTPYVLPGVLLGSINFIVVTGLTIQKRTGLVALNVCAVALLNLLMNFALIPLWGLIGAAIATTVAYGALVASNYFGSRSVIPLRICWATVGKSLAGTGCMCALLSGIGPVSTHVVLDCAARGSLGLMVAATCFWVLDAPLREWIREQIRTRRRFGTGDGCDG